PPPIARRLADSPAPSSPSWKWSRACSKSSGRRRSPPLLTHVGSEEVLGFDQPAAELAGRIWGDLERTGQPIGLADPVIAAIALTHSLELVTGNTSHYQRIQQLGYPLTLVNWRQ